MTLGVYRLLCVHYCFYSEMNWPSKTVSRCNTRTVHLGELRSATVSMRGRMITPVIRCLYKGGLYIDGIRLLRSYFSAANASLIIFRPYVIWKENHPLKECVFYVYLPIVKSNAQILTLKFFCQQFIANSP